MTLLMVLAAKSLLVAGIALLLLRLARHRSAAERSWIAHLGLAALVLLPLATVALPALEVQTSYLDSPAETQPAAAAPVAKEAAADAESFPVPAIAAAEPAEPRNWLAILYFVPAALLFLFTLIALTRLIALRARASVLVEPNWLTALARAQRRMGFKHGTALLTSDDLPSPISWGVMRPVILLNSEAANSHAEAEAIIAHELAHVASLDWAKLLLSRVTVALFWFNPLVWLLAREAHQLREEAADDAVLGADIVDTEYAQLLVGVARHECRGLLIGAHGVAPAKNSLARRVKRVLDSTTIRGPAGRAFASGVAVGGLLFAAPLAALTLVPRADKADTAKPYYGGAAPLGETIADAANDAAAAAGDVAADTATAVAEATSVAAGAGRIEQVGGRTEMVSSGGNRITIYPPDSNGRQKVVMRNQSGGVLTYPDARTMPGHLALPGVDRAKPIDLEDVVAAKAVGMTAQYVAEMRAASPGLRHAEVEELVGLRGVGVTPSYVREFAALGYGDADADELTGARAVGVTPEYVRSLRAAGLGRLSIDDLTSLRARGVTADDVRTGKPNADDPDESG